MKLLIELADPKTLEILKEDTTTDTGEKKKSYLLKGPMIGCGIKNRNGRTYPKEIIEREVKKFQQMIKENEAVGTCDHDQSPQICMDKISHKIIQLEMVGNEAIGVAKVLDTPSGKILQALIEGNVKIGMSTRGVGSLDEAQNVKDDFSLLSIDAVNQPSYINAKVTAEAVYESEDWELNGDKWVKVCKDGKCKMVKKSELKEEVKVENPKVIEEKIIKEDINKNKVSKSLLDEALDLCNNFKYKK